MVVGPILSQARSDVFCDNENGPNFLFQNNGDGTFVDVARKAGVYDELVRRVRWRERNLTIIYCSVDAFIQSDLDFCLLEACRHGLGIYR